MSPLVANLLIFALGLFVGGFATIVAIAFLFGIANNEDIDID